MKSTTTLLLLHSSFYCLGVLTVLILVYPVAQPYRVGLMTVRETVVVYLGMSALIALLGSALIMLTGRVRTRVLRSIAVFALGTILLSAYGVAIGTMSAQAFARVPLERMNGHFLRNFMEIKFSFVVAPICGALLGVWAWAAQHQIRR